MTRFAKGFIMAVSAAAFVATVTLGGIAGAQEKKSPPKVKSKCNSITEETACKADTTCTWIAASVDSKTGKQKRKAYCKTKSTPKKKEEKK